MFFKNSFIFVGLKFLWIGLLMGLVYLVFNLLTKVSKRNLYFSNIVGFCFWLAFGMLFSWCSILNYNYSFCWFGLLFMLSGFFFVKKTQQIFFTKFILLLYNSVTKRKLPKGIKNGEIQTNKKS